MTEAQVPEHVDNLQKLAKSVLKLFNNLDFALNELEEVKKDFQDYKEKSENELKNLKEKMCINCNKNVMGATKIIHSTNDVKLFSPKCIAKKSYSDIFQEEMKKVFGYALPHPAENA